MQAIKAPTSYLFQNLRECWALPERPVVQTGEGQYAMLANPLTAELACVQLFLAAFRHFPRLSTESPLQDRQGEKMAAFLNERCLAHFLQTAKTLGFHNPKGGRIADDATGYSDAVLVPQQELPLPEHCQTGVVENQLPRYFKSYRELHFCQRCTRRTKHPLSPRPCSSKTT